MKWSTIAGLGVAVVGGFYALGKFAEGAGKSVGSELGAIGAGVRRDMRDAAGRAIAVPGRVVGFVAGVARMPYDLARKLATYPVDEARAVWTYYFRHPYAERAARTERSKDAAEAAADDAR